MGAEEAAPAHAHGGEHSYRIPVDDALACELRDETQRCAYCTESRNREGNELRRGETEEPLEYETYLAGKPREQPCSLICASRIDHYVVAHRIHSFDRTAEGEHHDEGRYHKHARDDGKPYLHTALSAVQEGVENADEPALVLFVLTILFLLFD